jgi:hypothetical protein
VVQPPLGGIFLKEMAEMIGCEHLILLWHEGFLSPAIGKQRKLRRTGVRARQILSAAEGSAKVSGDVRSVETTGTLVVSGRRKAVRSRSRDNV